MKLNIRALYDLGFRRFAVTNVPPSGCFPLSTRSNNYTYCNEAISAVATLHDQLQRAMVSGLQETLRNATFSILDVRSALLHLLEGVCVCVSVCFHDNDLQIHMIYIRFLHKYEWKRMEASKD